MCVCVLVWIENPKEFSQISAADSIYSIKNLFERAEWGAETQLIESYNYLDSDHRSSHFGDGEEIRESTNQSKIYQNEPLIISSS